MDWLGWALGLASGFLAAIGWGAAIKADNGAASKTLDAGNSLGPDYVAQPGLLGTFVVVLMVLLSITVVVAVMAGLQAALPWVIGLWL